MKIPYGYVLANQEIIVHEEKADVVRSIFGHYLAGASLGKIVDILNKYDEIKDLLSSEHTDLEQFSEIAIREEIW